MGYSAWIDRNSGLVIYVWIDVCKGKYDGECVSANIRVVCARAVRETADGEEYSERLILESVKQLISFENQNIGSGW